MRTVFCCARSAEAPEDVDGIGDNLLRWRELKKASFCSTTLCAAVYHRNEKEIDWLLQHGAVIDWPCRSGATALTTALMCGPSHFFIAEHLVSLANPASPLVVSCVTLVFMSS